MTGTIPPNAPVRFSPLPGGPKNHRGWFRGFRLEPDGSLTCRIWDTRGGMASGVRREDVVVKRRRAR